jgi:hypothetical protein
MASPVRRGRKGAAIMLADLTDEQLLTCEAVALDRTLAAQPIDEQAMLAQVAYEAALQLDAARWWIPARRRRPTACRCEVLA